MLHWFKRNARLARTGQRLYERIVAQARTEAFYRDLRVPDTMDGRLELILLHLVLLLERLKSEGVTGQRIGQVVIERLIADMDDALRQIGIGDMGVPRRIQKAAAALRERVQDYGPGAAGVEEALVRNVYRPAGEGDFSDAAHALAAYCEAARAALAGGASDDLLAGRISFPPLPRAG